MTPPTDLALLHAATDMLREAGELTLQWFRSATLEVERKSDGSPVTQADKAAERFLRAGSPPATAPVRHRLDVGYALVLAPVALAGLVWLLAVTDWQIYVDQWLPLSVMFLLMLLLQRFQFSLYTELPSGLISGSTGSLSAVIDWSAVLLFGLTVEGALAARQAMAASKEPPAEDGEAASGWGALRQ